MGHPNRPGDASENNHLIDITAESGQASEQLLEQLNHRMLKKVHDSIININENVMTQAPSPTQASPKRDAVRFDFSSIIKGIVLLLPLLIALVTCVVWINSTIESKVKESRLELKQDIQLMKQDLSEQNKDTQTALTRLSDRNDNQFDKINDKLDRIGQKIDDSKGNN